MKRKEKHNPFSRLTSKNFWLLGLFVFLQGIFFLSGNLDAKVFYFSIASITLFSVIYFLFTFRQIHKVEKYQQLIEFLDIEESNDFDERNSFARALIFPSDIRDEKFEVFSYSKPYSFLGGDLFFQSKDAKGRYWFAIGDASGHDINSHLFSMMLVSGISSFIHTCESPKEITDNLNRDLKLRSILSGHPLPCYASLVVIQSDADGKMIHYGQHPNLIVFRGSRQETEVIETSGGFIGNENYPLPPSALLEPAGFQLESGDILFIFTDGVFEQKNVKNQYYGYRLYEFILNHPKEDLDLFLLNLYKEIFSFSQGKIQDDMTIMAIRKL